MTRLFWARIAASIIDGALAVGLCLLLAGNLGVFFAHRALVMLKIGSPDTLWQGPIPMALGIHGNTVYGFSFALFLVLLADPISGATFGKFILRLRVVASDGSPPPIFAQWRRFLLKASAVWMMTLALLVGRWEVAVLALSAGAVTLVGFALAFGDGSRALHDRLSGTLVRTSTGAR